jgi:hypothetical protein
MRLAMTFAMIDACHRGYGDYNSWNDLLTLRPFLEVVSSGVVRKRRPGTVSLFLVAFHQSKFRVIDVSFVL